MSCRSCYSERLNVFPSEMNIHAPGRAHMNKPTVWVFPRVQICLECGFAEFQLSQDGVVRESAADPKHKYGRTLRPFLVAPAGQWPWGEGGY